MTADPIRIALIGAGKMARVHADNIAHCAEAILVLVGGGAGAAALARRHRATDVDVQSALTAPQIDAVVIASPNPFHAEQIEVAAGAGKAVLVEKPVDLDLARVDACIAAVGHQVDRVLVAFNRRFDPAIEDLRHRLSRNDLGTLQQLLVTSRDPAPPPLEYVPSSGGLFRDMTIHDFDLVRLLAGEVGSVQAVAQDTDPDLRALGDHSGAVVTCAMRSGAMAVVVNARWNAGGFDQRVEATGSLGTLATTNPVAPAGRQSPDAPFYLERYRTSYRSEIDHLVEVTRGQVMPRSTLHDGRAALALAVAAERSVRSGRMESPETATASGR